MTTTATRTSTTTLINSTAVRCQADGCHAHGLPGYLFSINTARTVLTMKCHRCRTEQTIDLRTLKVVH